MANYPQFSYINAITNDKEAIVTFTEDHDFTIGEIVSFRVSKPFGMIEINNLRGKVLDISALTITVDIDTSLWTPFDYSNLNEDGTSPPVCVPSSSGVISNLYTPEINILDTFDRRP